LVSLLFERQNPQSNGVYDNEGYTEAERKSRALKYGLASVLTIPITHGIGKMAGFGTGLISGWYNNTDDPGQGFFSKATNTGIDGYIGSNIGGIGLPSVVSSGLAYKGISEYLKANDIKRQKRLGNN